MKGKISAVVFRAMAVVSALAIGGGYVAWRHGEAEKAMAEQAEAKEKVEREKLLREVDEAWQESVKELELLPGSKNPGRSMTRGEIDAYLEKGRDFIHPIPGIPGGSDEVTNIKTRLLPGSKSMPMPLFTKEQLDSRTGADSILPALEEEEPAPGNLLPSSKIGILRLPKKEGKPVEKKDIKLLPGSKSIDSILDNPNRKKSE
jgi:hypothetical protein